MERSLIRKAIEEVDSVSKERKFKQSYDLIINFKDLNLKKPENHLDFYVTLHHGRGKKIKVAAIVGPELKEEAEKVCDFTVTAADLEGYAKDKKKAKKLAESYDYFIGQATIMPKIAQALGRVFGPRNKMPNPKSGCIVPPKASLGPLYEKLQKTVRIMVKKDPVLHIMIGREGQDLKEIEDNFHDIYTQVVHHLPLEKNNIKNVYLKKTMGKPVKVGK